MDFRTYAAKSYSPKEASDLYNAYVRGEHSDIGRLVLTTLPLVHIVKTIWFKSLSHEDFDDFLSFIAQRLYKLFTRKFLPECSPERFTGFFKEVVRNCMLDCCKKLFRRDVEIDIPHCTLPHPDDVLVKLYIDQLPGLAFASIREAIDQRFRGRDRIAALFALECLKKGHRVSLDALRGYGSNNPVLLRDYISVQLRLFFEREKKDLHLLYRQRCYDYDHSSAVTRSV